MAVDMFLKIKDIKGESIDKAFKGEIDILSWSWGMSNAGTTHMGGGGGTGKVQVQDISIMKYVDASSNALISHCCDGTHIPTVELVCRKAGGKEPLPYIKIELEEVLVSSFQLSGSSGGDDRLTESISFNFRKFKYTYQQQKKEGGAEGGEKVAEWDIAANAKEA